MTEKPNSYMSQPEQQKQMLSRLIPKDQLTALWGTKAPIYLQQLWEYGLFELSMGSSLQELYPLIQRLTKGETSLDEKTVTLLSLRAQKQPNERVRQARIALQNFFRSPEINLLIKTGNYIPLVSGSIQYCDPKNLDADILLLSTTSLPQDTAYDMHFTINDSLIEYWEQQHIGTEPHVSTFSTVDFSPDMFFQNPDLWLFQTDVCSQAYTAMPILPNDSDRLSALRPPIRDLINQSPVTAAIANGELSTCLQVRIARASVV